MKELERVYLRPLTVEDAATSWRWRNDKDLWRFTGSRPDVHVTELVEKEWALKATTDETRLNYAICLSPSNRYIGNIYLVNIHDSCGELGVFIGEKNCQGKGYAQQALALLKEAAKRDKGITRIVIEVRPDNTAAMITYLKSGAKFIGLPEWIKLEI